MSIKERKSLLVVLASCNMIFIGCSASSDSKVKDSEDEETEIEIENEKTKTPETPILTWKTIPVPAVLPSNQEWEFQEISDNFEYNAPAEGKTDTFLAKWDDYYHNSWQGPGLTEWRRDHSMVEDGLLQLIASRKENSDKIHLGCITSKNRIIYPVYIEARAKVLNSVLACGVWLLSPDDTQEIDFLEAYGATYSESAQKEQSWYAERIHVSHHVFIRDPFQDYQPKDQGSWVTDNGRLWKDDFHRYGVYWRDPWHLEYYIDGNLVRTVSGKEIIDPLYYTNATNQGDITEDTRTGLSKEMDIIIDAEDTSI